MNTVDHCRLIELPKIEFRSGNLTTTQNSREIPFEIKRIFYIYDIPGGQSRGAHAHRKCHQFFVSVSGSFEVQIDDGKIQKTVTLNQPHFGLHLPPGIWAAEQNFSSGAVCLVLTSSLFDEHDYIRDYQEFLKFKRL